MPTRFTEAELPEDEWWENQTRIEIKRGNWSRWWWKLIHANGKELCKEMGKGSKTKEDSKIQFENCRHFISNLSTLPIIYLEGKVKNE